MSDRTATMTTMATNLSEQWTTTDGEGLDLQDSYQQLSSVSTADATDDGTSYYDGQTSVYTSDASTIGYATGSMHHQPPPFHLSTALLVHQPPPFHPSAASLVLQTPAQRRKIIHHASNQGHVHASSGVFACSMPHGRVVPMLKDEHGCPI